MKSPTLIKEAHMLQEEINEQLTELNSMIESEEESETILKQLDSWRVNVSRLLDRSFSTDQLSWHFLQESKVVLNKLSVAENAKTLREGLERSKQYLIEILAKMETGEYK